MAYPSNVARCEQQVGRSRIPVGAPYDDAQTYCEHNSSPSFNGFLLRDLDTILQGIATFVILPGPLRGSQARL